MTGPQMRAFGFRKGNKIPIRMEHEAAGRGVARPKRAAVLLLMLAVWSCSGETDRQEAGETGERQLAQASGKGIPVILDTDANNELDDQHAIAYMLFNGDVFDVKGITVNATEAGGPVARHMEEARRIVTLAGLEGRIPVKQGADGSYRDIYGELGAQDYDGREAVQFIIEQARAHDGEELVLLAIGKLTNIALALQKEPGIASQVRVVWLGSNYPQTGEYNKENDRHALRYLLDAGVPFEMVTVRYGEPSGTDAVTTTPGEISERMPGLGPEIEDPVTGRYGGNHTTFGDYSVALFDRAELYGDPPGRALYDMAAVAIVKNPEWAETTRIPAPELQPGEDGEWVERSENDRHIILWEHFDRDAIMQDFFRTMEDYTLPR